MAMIYQGTVFNLAVWDGVSEWNPIAAGYCDTIVDVTSDPQVQVGWTYSSGTFAPGG